MKCSAFIDWVPAKKGGALLLLTIALAACDRGGVQVYQVSKETPNPAPAAAPHDHAHGDAGNVLPELTWKLPQGWEEAAPGQMRFASFRVPGKDKEVADVGVFPLPGLAGSDLDNVNRWRGQVSQAPVTAEELAASAQTIPVDGLQAKLYEQAGDNPGSGEKTRILAAILRRDNIAWFFKMTGPDELVAGQREAFVDFLKSMKFTARTSMELPPDHPPIDMASMAATAPTPGATAQPKPLWKVPTGWKEAPAGQFLVAKFGLPDTEIAQASVNVSMSTGEGGGLVGNVNRWRRQLGLEEAPEAEVTKSVKTIEVEGGKASLVDIAGTDARTGEKARVIGAIVAREGQTWFYKLSGPESVVQAQSDAFINFVRSVTYPNAP